MKYAAVLRKLIINNNTYYQIIDKVVGDRYLDEFLVMEGDLENQKLKRWDIGLEGEKIYYELLEEEYNNLEVDETEFLKEEDGLLLSIKNIVELNQVILEFYRRFNDFKLIPDFDMDKIFNETLKNIKKRIIGQDKMISKVLSKIYYNQLFIEGSLDPLDKQKNKSNILVIGPSGCGKTSLKNELQKNLYPLPVVEYNLTGKFEIDIINIIEKLIVTSNYNMYLASRGIVIFDGISALSRIDDNFDVKLYMQVLERILKANLVSYIEPDQNKKMFDYSMITNICLVDMDYDMKNIDDVDYYSRISYDNFMLLGMTPDFVFDCFDNEVIYSEEMTPSLALKILKDKNLSPLYQIKRTFEEKGKKVRIDKEFVPELIKYGLEFNEGFTGIIRTLKYLLEEKDISSKVVNFQKDDFDDIRVGIPFVSLEDEDEYSYLNKSSKSNPTLKTNLDVNMKAKTINGLSLKQTVDLIRENIKGQDEQIFTIVNAFYKHTFNKYKNFSKHQLKELKENVLLIGDTGVGKTAIVENLSRIFNTPYKREIAPRYSKSGYVGESVDSILVDLIQVANGDVEKAQNAILYVDEVDKIRATKDQVDMGLGVQDELLTLIEGDIRSVQIPSKYPGESNMVEFDTSGLFVIASGAFRGLKEITDKRLKEERTGKVVGFKTEPKDKIILKSTTVDDLEQYGMDPQFIGRLPNVIHLNLLNEDILYEIINDSKNGYINLNREAYQKDGITLEMSETFKRSLAKKAYLDKKGARSIKTVFAEIIKEIDKNVLEGNVEKVILDGEVSDNHSAITYVKKR